MNAAVLDRATFLEQRRKYLGGSDISAVLGISPWRTPVQLWAEKSRPPAESEKGKPYKRRGQRWESVVAEMLVEELQLMGHQVEIAGTNRRYLDERCAHFACEIDFELRLNGAEEITNCELKTVHPFKAREWGAEGTDECPVWYTAQAMWGLGITGRKLCIVAPLFGADEIKVYPVERDEATIEAMRGKAEAFWLDHVIAGVPPPPLTVEDLEVLHATESGRGLIADEALTATVLRMRACDREIRAREAERDALEFDIKRAMGDCGELIVRDKVAATWKRRPYTYLDQTGLKDTYPKVHKEFTRKGESRVFQLKQFAWE